MRCARIDCGWTGYACFAFQCPAQPLHTPQQTFIPPTPSPRFLPVNIPFSDFGITVVTMDRDGNVTVKVNQHLPQANADE